MIRVCPSSRECTQEAAEHQRSVRFARRDTRVQLLQHKQTNKFKNKNKNKKHTQEKAKQTRDWDVIWTHNPALSGRMIQQFLGT